MAYIDAPEVYGYVILSAPDQTSLDKGARPFEEVVKSFRYFGPDSGVYLACSTARRIRLANGNPPDVRWTRTEGWKLLTREPDVTVYSRAEGKAYGVIAVYALKVSEGNPGADYEAAWADLAQRTFGAGPAPMPEAKSTREGWQVRVGNAEIEREGQPARLMLVLFCGYGKQSSIVALFNDQSLLPHLDDFVDSIQLQGALRGEWAAADYSSPRYLHGEWIPLSEGGYDSRILALGRDGTYLFLREAKVNSGQYWALEERGTYSVSENRLTLHGQGGTQRELGDDGRTISSEPLPTWERTYLFKLVDVEEAVHGPYMVLQGVAENNLDGGYTDFFPNAFVYVRGYHPEWRFR
ncbi:MAG: hypothetical protein AB7S38_35340 [Vulcanimicrobiota bacterium]